MDNIHLHIAKFLLENREVAKMLATAIDTALESMDAYIQREIDRYLAVAKDNGKDINYHDELTRLKRYWESKYYNDISLVAGVQDYTPHGCEGEQVYKFIQVFTEIGIEIGSTYTQAEFNALTEDPDDDYYTENAITNSQSQADAETNV